MKRIEVIKNLDIISKELNSVFFAQIAAIKSTTSVTAFYVNLINSKTSYDILSPYLKKIVKSYNLDLY